MPGRLGRFEPEKQRFYFDYSVSYYMKNPEALLKLDFAKMDREELGFKLDILKIFLTEEFFNLEVVDRLKLLLDPVKNKLLSGIVKKLTEVKPAAYREITERISDILYQTDLVVKITAKSVADNELKSLERRDANLPKEFQNLLKLQADLIKNISRDVIFEMKRIGLQDKLFDALTSILTNEVTLEEVQVPTGAEKPFQPTLGAEILFDLIGKPVEKDTQGRPIAKFDIYDVSNFFKYLSHKKFTDTAKENLIKVFETLKQFVDLKEQGLANVTSKFKVPNLWAGEEGQMKSIQEAADAFKKVRDRVLAVFKNMDAEGRLYLIDLLKNLNLKVANIDTVIAPLQDIFREKAKELERENKIQEAKQYDDVVAQLGKVIKKGPSGVEPVEKKEQRPLEGFEQFIPEGEGF